MSHPACCHHHAGRGLQGTRQCGHITSVAICAPQLPVPDCLRVAAPSLSLLGCLHPASSLPPHSTPCRYNNPAPWCSQSHFHTPCLIYLITRAIYPPTQYIPPLLNLLLLPPSQHWSPSPPLIKVYQRESTEADNWNFVKYPLAPWCRCTAAIETVLWSG